MPDRSRSRFRTRVRVPAAVLAATFAFGALAALWSVVAPLAEAPDEPAHLALVLYLADGHSYPDFDGVHNQQAIVRLCATYAAATRACPRTGEPVTPTSTRRHPRADAPDKASRPAWDDAGGAAPLGQLNQMPQHPPLYYEAMATVLRVERAAHGGPWSADRELALLRLVNALVVMPIPLLAWWAARRVGLDHTTAVTASVLTLGLPMLTHIGSTLNNDNLLTVLGAGIVALVAGVLRGDRSARTAVAIGTLTGLGLLTKSFAVVFLPFIAVGYLIGLRADRAETGRRRVLRRLRPAAIPLAIAGGVTVILSAWWYVRVRIRTGHFAPSVEDDRLTTALRPPGFHAHLWPFLREYGRDLDQRFWGSFGWYTVRFSTGFTYALTAVLAAAVGTALVSARVRGGVGTGRRDAVRRDAVRREGDARHGPAPVPLLVLLLPVAALLVVVFQHAWSLHVRTSKFQFLQGRYLFAGIAGVAVVAAVGVVRWVGRWAPLAALAAACGLQAWGVWRCLVGWWGGPGLGPRGQVRALTAWSGWPGGFVGLIFVAAAVGAVALSAALVADLRGGPEVVADPSPAGVDQ
ncbi:MAG: hypothetical protein JWM89_3905 [Acidimicrobiales bacterium]|nr:hypothetical protein [Acidimicrobiales bacterium]